MYSWNINVFFDGKIVMLSTYEIFQTQVFFNELVQTQQDR